MKCPYTTLRAISIRSLHVHEKQIYTYKNQKQANRDYSQTGMKKKTEKENMI